MVMKWAGPARFSGFINFLKSEAGRKGACRKVCKWPWRWRDETGFPGDHTRATQSGDQSNPTTFSPAHKLCDRPFQVERVSLASDGTEGNGFSGEPAISASDRYVTFESNASNLVPDDTNGVLDIFLASAGHWLA